MVSRKRARQEMEAEAPLSEPTVLDRIRSMWEFANLAQYLFIFGKAIKIDQDLDIEVGYPLSGFTRPDERELICAGKISGGQGLIGIHSRRT